MLGCVLFRSELRMTLKSLFLYSESILNIILILLHPLSQTKDGFHLFHAKLKTDGFVTTACQSRYFTQEPHNFFDLLFASSSSSSSSVLANFRGMVQHGLPLEIGDTVQILEKCEGSRCCCVADNQPLSSCISSAVDTDSVEYNNNTVDVFLYNLITFKFLLFLHCLLFGCFFNWTAAKEALDMFCVGFFWCFFMSCLIFFCVKIHLQLFYIYKKIQLS